MRQRLTQQQRRADILKHASALFHQHGFATTEMEDIRKACAISRGGLYHHFANKGAILDAIIVAEVAGLAELLKAAASPPIQTLLSAGSGHLGQDPGIVTALKTDAEKRAYLSGLDRAIAEHLSPVLSEKLETDVKDGTDPGHLADLFLTVNAHINRRVCLGDWGQSQAAGFAATALSALAPLLKNPAQLDKIIDKFNEIGSEK